MTIGKSASTTIFNIQILRFIAASMVLFGHLQHEVLDRKWISNGPFTAFTPIFWPGGVDIFFVISGFIMFYISATHFGSVKSSLNFLKRRFIRVLPLYWLCTTLMVISSLMVGRYIDNGQIDPIHLALSYLMIPAVSPEGGLYPFFLIGWTLEYEVFFYAVFAIALLLKRSKGVVFIFCAFLALAIISFLRPTWPPLAYWSNPIVLEFLMGISLAKARLAGVRLPRVAGLCVTAAGFGLMVVLHSLGWTETNWPFRWAWMGLPALVICAGLALEEEKGSPRGLKRLMVFGGDASYALYMSHPFTLNFIALIWLKFGLHIPDLYILVSFAGSLAAAAACHVWLEKPIYTDLTAWLMPRPSRATQR